MELIPPPNPHLVYNPAVECKPVLRHGARALSSAKKPPAQQPPDEESDSPEDSDSPEEPDSLRDETAPKWTLTKEALDRLLACFSSDPEEAGRQYELMRLRLLRFFERRRCLSPEDLIDKTIDIVARRIDEGENIHNLSGYFLSVARLVFMEWLRWLKNRPSIPLDDVPEIPDEPPPDDLQKEARLSCLDGCLAKLSAEERKLILDYYADMKRAKIDRRRELAEESTLNALRIRTYRIRKRLEKCVNECLKTTTDSEMNLPSDSL